MNGTPDGSTDTSTEDVEGHRLVPGSVRTVHHTNDSTRKVATVLSVVTTSTDDGVHLATALLKPVTHGPEGVGGWILVKAGDTVLAQVNVKAGKAVASWTMPDHVACTSVVLTYTGDELHAPSSRTLEL